MEDESGSSEDPAEISSRRIKLACRLGSRLWRLERVAVRVQDSNARAWLFWFGSAGPPWVEDGGTGVTDRVPGIAGSELSEAGTSSLAPTLRTGSVEPLGLGASASEGTATGGRGLDGDGNKEGCGLAAVELSATMELVFGPLLAREARRWPGLLVVGTPLSLLLRLLLCEQMSDGLFAAAVSVVLVRAVAVSAPAM